MVIAQPPLQYLITSSQAGLESFVLSRQGQVANLRREVLEVVEEWIEAETQSRAARWILECRRSQNAYEIPLENLELAEFDYLPQAPALPAGAMPLFDNPPLVADSRSRASAQLNGYSPRDRPEHVVATEEPSPESLGLSSRAEDALIVLEHHIRSQADTIDVETCGVAVHAADRSVPAGSETKSHLGERSGETLNSKSFHPSVVPSSEISAHVQRHVLARQDDVAESAVSETVQVRVSLGLKKPNLVIPIPRKVHRRPLFQIRVPFLEIPCRRRAV